MGNIRELFAGTQDTPHSVTIEAWYRRHTKGDPSRCKYTYIAGKRNGEIKAVVMYFDYTGYSVTMDICAPKALTKTFIRTMFNYPFNQLKVTKLFGFIDSRNLLSQKTFTRLGCREVAKIPSFFGDGIDRLVYEATKEDVAKWVT